MPDRRRHLPSVEVLLGHPWVADAPVPRPLKRRAVREAIAEARAAIAAGDVSGAAAGHPESAAAGGGAAGETSADQLAARAVEFAARLARPALRPVINATGVVVHTNLGRSLLAPSARAAVLTAASRYVTLEIDLETGERGSRQGAVRELLCELTGAEDALAVNNNAAAVLLALSGLAGGREVIVSRGELIEIGGSFRIPDIMARSGARLREVGTTNKTRVSDYEQAIGPETALLFKAHRSNFVMSGFVSEVTLPELVALGETRGVPVVEDLGSGALLDLSPAAGHEPTARESLEAGAALVMFSGDKLLGGPQAGLLVGRRELIGRLARDPMARALRLDKLALAALEATLRLYLEPERAWAEIPTLHLLARPAAELSREAEALASGIAAADPGLETKTARVESRVGGGALPLLPVPSWGAAARPRPGSGRVEELDADLRQGEPAVLGRLDAGWLILDVRTILPGEIPEIIRLVGQRAQGRAPGRR
jgi:L-seryl-tRNA(Ser) seleniumtransferase